MKVYGFEKPFGFMKKDIPMPDALGKDDVLVRVSHIGLCGSDIHLYKGTYGGPNVYPVLFGHEWSGFVEICGTDVTEFKPGDIVTGDCSRYCGECAFCAQDKNLCQQIEKFGITVDGASAEYIVRNRKYLYKASPGADPALLSMTEPVSVAMHHIKKVISASGDIKGKRILVYGGGAIGQAMVFLLKEYFGCTQVDFFDIIPYRCDTAAALGAVVVEADALAPPASDSYADMYNHSKYDVIFETTGVADVFLNALRLLRPMGVLGCLGMNPEIAIPQKLIVVKSLTIVGSIGGTGEFGEVIPFIHRHAQQLSRIISHRFPIEEMEAAFETATKTSRAIKVLLMM